MPDRIERFPLFPLGLVLLPSEIVPLHIFEERYKTMIGECMEEDSEFGIVWLSEDGLREVGCSARIARVLDEMDDGRMNILVRGGAPFRLVRRIDDMAYPAGVVEFHDDAAAEAEADPEQAAETRERYAELVEQVTDERPTDDELLQLDAYGMAATIDFEAPAKQKLLELRDEAERLEMVLTMFAETLRRLEFAEHAAERAKGNGKVRLR